MLHSFAAFAFDLVSIPGGPRSAAHPLAGVVAELFQFGGARLISKIANYWQSD